MQVTVDMRQREGNSRFRVPILVGSGTALLGAAGYAFVALAGHTLRTDEVAAVSSFYLMINIIGPGVFVAVEQETSRATSAAISSGQEFGPVVRQALVRAGGLLVAVLAVLVACAPMLVDRSLVGHGEMLGAVALGAITAAAIHSVRGVLAGMRQFSGYATTLFAEAATRLVPVLGLAVAGTAVAGLYGFVFAIGSGVGALTGLRWTGKLWGTPLRRKPAERAESRGAAGGGITNERLGLLVGATLLAQVLANLAPIVVTARAVADTAMASAFASAFIVARVPLLIFAPVQTVLLPAVTAAVTRGDHKAVHRTLRWMLAGVVGVGSIGALVAATTGPWVIDVLFGARVELPGSVLGWLGVSTVLLMSAQVAQTALIAYRRHRALAISWSGGTAVLALLLVVPSNPVASAVVAQLAGAALVALSMLSVLIIHSRAHTSVTKAHHAGPGPLRPGKTPYAETSERD